MKHWFARPGWHGGRHVSSQGLRAGLWRPGSRIPGTMYLRPTQAERNDPFEKVPLHTPQRTRPDF